MIQNLVIRSGRARGIGKIVDQFKAKKIIIQKFRCHKNMRRRNGHRQPYTMVQITTLGLPQ